MVTQTRPNILLITCHDLGRFLNCYGVTTVHTPNIDALAAGGTIFTQAFCTAPQCSPSRAGLFTGRYPHSNGVMGLTHANFAWDLYPEEQHLGQLLHAAGYRTVMFGVHHESRRLPDEKRIAERCGMDEIGLSGIGSKVTDRALEALSRYASSDQPFYMQVGYREPHRQRAKLRTERNYMGFLGDYIQPDASLGISIPPYLQDTEKARAEMAELQGAVRYLDECVGRLIAGLDESGLMQNTLVVFTTDHGLALPRAKCTLYDPGLEIALIMRLPSSAWRPSISSLVSNIDVVPTILDLLGLPLPANLQGHSLLGLLAGRPDARPRQAVYGEMTYHEYYDPIRCIRTETHKLIVNFSAAPALMDCSQSWRPRANPVVPADPMVSYHPLVELYNLRDDPYERVNIAGETAAKELRSALLGQLHQWMRATDDPLLKGPVPSPMHRWAMDLMEGEGRRT